MEKSLGTLFLIPVPLAEDASDTIPVATKATLSNIKYFLAEEPKTARRMLRLLDPEFSFEGVEISELSEHTDPNSVRGLVKPLTDGNSIGILSESGCPCVADPGALAVREAHRLGAKVIPCVGPSSILLALMASGLNGQSFAFVGYLPREIEERRRVIKKLEKESKERSQTQIFIETPYRNHAVFDDLLSTCNGDTNLCIASQITSKDEWIRTLSIAQWRENKPSLPKEPCTFVLAAL